MERIAEFGENDLKLLDVWLNILGKYLCIPANVIKQKF